MNKGFLAALTAYSIWGLLPIYWKLLEHVPSDRIVCHRIIWSCAVLVFFLCLTGRIQTLWKAINASIFLAFSLGGLLIGINWFLYIWGVNSGHVLEASLGYFINPLFSVILGMLVFQERLRALQWLPVILAAGGVVWLTLQHDRIPWIALLLGTTFSLYGLVKKKATLGAFESLTLETGILVPIALTWLLLSPTQTNSTPGTNLETILLLSGAGIVTTVPLVLFGAAAKSIPLFWLGILQYIAPTLQFLLGVFLFHEPFNRTQLIGFSCVWMALFLFGLEGWHFWSRSRIRLSPLKYSDTPKTHQSHAGHTGKNGA